MDTGLPSLMPVYSTQETQQRVQRQGRQGEEDGGEMEGAVLWLPHQVGLHLRMVWPAASAAADCSANGSGASSNSNGSKPAALLPGLEVGVSWVPEKGTVLTLSRLYSGQGELQRASFSTAIRMKG